MTDTALFVDDEEYVLNAVQRLFAESPIRILRTESAREALELVSAQEIAVIVSDNLMPGMSGIELLSRVKETSPDTVKILMTAHADLPTAINAINEGEVFRFIVKPWDNELLKQTVEDAVNRYRVVQSLKKADEATLLSLAQTIELKDPYTRGHCDRVARYALMIAEALHMGEVMQQEIKYGSWLHDCGKIGIPENILNSRDPLTEEQFALIKNHPSWGAEVARQAHLSREIVNIILYHHERYNGSGYPSGKRGEEIPLEARILAVADVFDALITERPYGKVFTLEEGVEHLVSMKGDALDPDLVTIFLSRIDPRRQAAVSDIRVQAGE